MHNATYIVAGTGESIRPGTPEHEFATVLLNLGKVERLKILKLIRTIAAGDLPAAGRSRVRKQFIPSRQRATRRA